MRDLCVAMKVKDNKQHKYMAYNIASYCLIVIRSGIQWIKSRDSSVNVISVLVSTIIFCYHMKSWC